MPESHISSPWLEQLKADRPHFKLEKNQECDVAIVGAGIAGVTTAYHILRHTDASVLLIDAGRIAHGATGRNAGQVTNYFERPFSSIIQEFGVKLAVEGHLASESAWGILDDMIEHCTLTAPLYRCMGYKGLVNLEEVIEHLEEQHVYATAGLEHHLMLISAHADVIQHIPEHLHSYYSEVPHSLVLESLHTENTQFIAASASPVGCINSALLCEELVAWMIATYGERITVAEHAPIHTINLRKDDADLLTDNNSIHAKKVVLCTNGFENFTINNLHGKDIDPSFHATVLGKIAYMTGYLDEKGKTSSAICYNSSHDTQNPYYYLTRRPYEHAKHGSKTLLCIGGPERDLPNGAEYNPNSAPPQDIVNDLHTIAHDIFKDAPTSSAQQFVWQGLMGHTPNRIRRIGFEPRNHTLLYNLGCNGVGILPSIYGGHRIAELLKGIHLPPSIFDPVMGE